MRPVNAEYSHVNITASTTAAIKEVVAAASGLRHRVLGVTISALAAQNLTLQSSTGGVLLGPINVAGGVPFVLPPSPMGYAETSASRGIYNQSDNATETFISMQYQTYAAT